MSSLGTALATNLVTSRAALLSYVRRRVGDLETAEDIVQEVALRALAGAAPDDPRPFLLWLCGIARHVICGEWRRRHHLSRKHPPADFLCEDVRDPFILPDRAHEARASLTHAIGPDVEHLSILFRRYVDHESSTEMAKELGLTAGSLRMRLGRIRARVRSRALRTT